MADLITLTELKTALGIAAGDVDPARDAKLQQAITNSSAIVSKYADRDFATSAVTEARTFEYDGSGYLEIDDASAITSVTFKWTGYDQVVDPAYWRGEPSGADVLTYLILPAQNMLISPEMGFTRNLDVLYRERQFLALPLFVEVTATWGWPTVPDDVKQAVIWTAAQVAEEVGGMRSESIAGYSYTRDTDPTTGQNSGAIPDRAKDVLAPYVRWH